MSQIRIEIDSANLVELVQKVAEGDEVVITRAQHPIARLVGYQATAKRRMAGTAKGLIHVADDFDAPIDDFTDYI